MALRAGSTLPPLEGATEWLNGQPSADEIQGHPLFIHFWSISCQTCHENMPTIVRWREQYSPLGLVVISVHIPRMESDLALDVVQKQIADMNLTEPCAIDNKLALTNAFENQYVPGYYFFSDEGRLVGRAVGMAGPVMFEGILENYFLRMGERAA